MGLVFKTVESDQANSRFRGGSVQAIRGVETGLEQACAYANLANKEGKNTGADTSRLWCNGRRWLSLDAARHAYQKCTKAKHHSLE